MKSVVVGITGVAAILAALMLEAADRPETDGPQFTAAGQLVRPQRLPGVGLLEFRAGDGLRTSCGGRV